MAFGGKLKSLGCSGVDVGLGVVLAWFDDKLLWATFRRK